MSRTLLSILLSLVLFPLAAQGQTFLGKSANDWRKELILGDDKARRGAAFALGKMGQGGVSGVGDLGKRLREDSSPQVREAAAFALGEIALESLRTLDDPAMLRALTEALQKDKDPLVRRSAAFALGCLRADALPSLAELENALSDREPVVRQNAAWALGKLGSKAVPALRKALQDDDVVVRRDAAATLVGLDPKEVRAALPELATCCAVDDSRLRKAALEVLIKLVGPEDEKVARALRPALEDKDVEVRRNAALALANIGGKEAAPAVKHLVEALRRGDLDTRRQAAAGLRNLGEAAGDAVDDLVRTLKDPDVEIRANTALALGGIGPKAAPAVNTLVGLLTNYKEEREVRLNAAVAISEIGPVPDAVAAIPGLIQVLGHAGTDAETRKGILWALRIHKGKMREYPEFFTNLSKVIREPKTRENRLLRYECARMQAAFKSPELEPVTLDTLVEWLQDSSIEIYLGTASKVGGAGAESATGKAQIQELGKGDGRVLALQVLQYIASDPQGADLLRRRADLLMQVRTLAADMAVFGQLRDQCRDLLKDLGK